MPVRDTHAQPARRHVIHLARTGERLEVEAPSVPEALRQTGRRDACHLTFSEGGRVAATFDPAAPSVIDVRCREHSRAELGAAALALVANCLDREAAGRRAEEVTP